MVTPNALSTQARLRSRLTSWAEPIPHKRFAAELEPEKPRTPRIGASFTFVSVRV